MAVIGLTYDFNTTNHESLMDYMDIVAQDETPMWDALPKSKADNVYVSWPVRALTTGNANAAIEGVTYTYTAHTAPTRVTASCQIFTKPIQVSLSQAASNPAGFKNDFTNEVKIQMGVIKTDIEKALINQTGNTGASGTARELTGFLSAISTNIETGTATGDQLREDVFNNMLQTVWAAGGRPHDIFVNGYQKRKISGFTANTTRFQDSKNGSLSGYVDIYFSDFGKMAIHLEPQMLTTAVLAVDKTKASIAVLRPIVFMETAFVGSAKNGVIEGELTLNYGHEKSHAKATGLKATA